MWTLTENDALEKISVAYLGAVCAKAGICVELHADDDDGTDVALKKSVVLASGDPYDVEISVQIKSTCRQVRTTEDAVYYDLKVKNYNDLRRPSSKRKYLFVLFGRETVARSVERSDESLSIMRTMYWTRGDVFPEKGACSSVRVAFSKENVASPERLAALMQEIAEEENSFREAI